MSCLRGQSHLGEGPRGSRTGPVLLCCAFLTQLWVGFYSGDLGVVWGPVSILAHCILFPLLKQGLPGLRTRRAGQRLGPHQLPAALPLPMGLSGGWGLRGWGRLGWCHQSRAEERTAESETEVQPSLAHAGPRLVPPTSEVRQEWGLRWRAESKRHLLQSLTG